MIYQDHLNQDALEQYAAGLNARAKALHAPGRLTAALLRGRILESGGCCEWCGRDLLGDEFELDHVVSLHQRGSNRLHNLAVACQPCNRRKADKHPARFAAEIYSATHLKTDLVARIMQRYGVDPMRQMSLFDGAVRPAATHIEVDESSAPVPPYSWAE